MSKTRLEEVRGELAGLQEQLQPLLARYRAEKHRLEEIRALRKKREDYLVRACPQPTNTSALHLLVGCNAAGVHLSLEMLFGHHCCNTLLV